MIPPRVAAFLAAAKAQEFLPYVWPQAKNVYSGKGLGTSLYPEGRDCSGLVSVSLRAAGDVVDRRGDWNAQRYWREMQRTAVPQPGDFVIFGTAQRATHIEILMEDGRTFGAMGDEDCLAPTEPRSRTKRVQYRRTPRRDLLGYVINPLR